MRATALALAVLAGPICAASAATPETRGDEPSSAPAKPDDAKRPHDEADTQQPSPPPATTVRTRVQGHTPRTAASEQTVRDRDLKLRPVTRPADILQVTPGLIVMQHAGGGKANQYFLRGFDIDHGTDLALSVDGVPVNLVSHGHGQGFADLHWLIPELVDRIEIAKGPYDVRHGDFATAGAVNLVTRRGDGVTRLQYSIGRYGEHRGLMMAGPRWKGGSALVAAEARTWDGPFDSPERARRLSAFGKLSLDLSSRTRIDIAATGYASTWNASGQIPSRLVRAGELDRFGSLDPSEGGSTQRLGLTASVRHRPSDDERLDALAYLAISNFQLSSNFTFFLEDPVNGDQIEQTDDRVLVGFKGSYSRRQDVGRGVALTHTLGLQTRFDRAKAGLFSARERERLATRIDSTIREAALGFFAEESARLTPWLQLVGGTRVDMLHFAVDGAPGGAKSYIFASPKLSAVFSPLAMLDVFLNFGIGYHSNDARAVVAGGTPFARATSGDVGFRVTPIERLTIGVSGYAIHLGEELVWSGDGGTTEASGETLRVGVEVEARLRVLDWLFVDADFTYNHGRFLDAEAGADRIPLAPTVTAAGGVSVRHPSGVYGRLGARFISDRPANEDNSLRAEGYALLDVSAGYEHRWFEVRLDLENLTNASYREAQFATTSRLSGEPPCRAPAFADGGGCADVDFTPGVPLNVRATVAMKF
ncbi:MAG: TonB-dependent receptor [Myxococcota bacterium]